MEYYIFDTIAEANEKNAEIYDLYCAQPASERSTIYAYCIYGNGIKFAMEYDGTYNAQGLLDGLIPETEQEVITQGYELDAPLNINQ